MKKMIFSFAIGTFAVALFPSCKKDYTCTCTTSSNAPGVEPSTASTIIRDRKDRARKECEDASTTYTWFGYTFTTTCDMN